MCHLRLRHAVESCAMPWRECVRIALIPGVTQWQRMLSHKWSQARDHSPKTTKKRLQAKRPPIRGVRPLHLSCVWLSSRWAAIYERRVSIIHRQAHRQQRAAHSWGSASARAGDSLKWHVSSVAGGYITPAGHHTAAKAICSHECDIFTWDAVWYQIC